MALHVVLLIPLMHWFNRPKEKKSGIPYRKLTQRTTAACLIAFALAAIQVLPTYEWAQSGSRKIRSSSRTTYEWASDQFSNTELPNHIFSGGLKSEHHGQLYQFSLAPWQLSELALPNITGRLYPQRHRWSFLFEDNPRTWYPSIYQGMLPLLLALCVFGIRRQSKHKQLSRLVLFSTLAALGSFGLGWLLTSSVPCQRSLRNRVAFTGCYAISSQAIYNSDIQRSGSSLPVFSWPSWLAVAGMPKKRNNYADERYTFGLDWDWPLPWWPVIRC